ncbi:MAG: hypothetical protein R2836_06480, partial [Chitinophagales bacterium]
MKIYCTLYLWLFFGSYTIYAQCQTWEDIGIIDTWSWASSSSSNYTNIAIDNNGFPIVVYQDGNQNNKATVKKYNGSNWQFIGNEGFTAGVASYTNIVLNNNNTPYISYTDYANGKSISVQKFDGNSWSVVGTAGFSGGEAYYTDIAIDNYNTLYVAYM